MKFNHFLGKEVLMDFLSLQKSKLSEIFHEESLTFLQYHSTRLNV